MVTSCGKPGQHADLSRGAPCTCSRRASCWGVLQLEWCRRMLMVGCASGDRTNASLRMLPHSVARGARTSMQGITALPPTSQPDLEMHGTPAPEGHTQDHGAST